jgi:hypothetical protein
VWLNTEGKVEPLFPWNEQWQLDFANDRARDRLSLPSDEGAAPLGGGPRGIESLILLIRDTPLPADVDLPALFAGIPPQDGLELGSAVWLENGRRQARESLERSAIKLNETKAVNDPVLRTQRLLSDRLQPHFRYSRAVCFSNEGDR